MSFDPSVLIGCGTQPFTDPGAQRRAGRSSDSFHLDGIADLFARLAASSRSTRPDAPPLSDPAEARGVGSRLLFADKPPGHPATRPRP